MWGFRLFILLVCHAPPFCPLKKANITPPSQLAPHLRVVMVPMFLQRWRA